MGEFGTTRIALRGPGCINGTGRCNVAGARGRCTNVFGTGDEIDKCNDVLGTGGRRCFDRFDDEVQGTGGRRCCDRFGDEVLGTGGRNKFHSNVLGTGGRRHKDWNCCEWIWSYLETPITVPR